MKLSDLRPDVGARSARKRLGRGTGSGLGKTSGKGHKGQKARAGGGVRPGFEGGQMPLQRRLPKRGFRHEKRDPFQIVNLLRLEEVEAGTVVSPEWLLNHGLIRTLKRPIKVLATGDFNIKVTVQAAAFSQAAKEKIEAAGGTAEVI